MPDGVFGEAGFHELDPPGDEEVSALLATVAARVLRLLRRKGRLEDEPDVDELGALQAASVQSRLPLPDDAPPPRRSRRSAFVDGFSLHAAVRIHANDREGLCACASTAPAVRSPRSVSPSCPMAASATA